MASPYVGNPAADTFIFQAGATTNYSAATDAYAGSTGAGGIAHFLATFDLSTIPAGAVVVSATLDVYIQADLSGNTYKVHRVLKNQNPAQATYNAFSTGNNWATAGMGSGTDYAAAVMGSLAISTTGAKQFALDATEVGLMLGTNYGIMIKSTDDSNSKYINIEPVNVGTHKPTLTITYTVPPVVTSVTANVGPTCGGISVVIAGSGFTGASSVTFGGVAATGVSVDSDTQITCTVPAHAAGAVTVAVTTSGGTGSKTTAFTYNDPTVASCAASDGTTNGGTSVTLTGTYLTGVTGVTFGGTPAANMSVVSSTSITCTTPAKADGAVNVVVSNGTSTGTLVSGYTYHKPAPTLVTPSIGSSSGGTAVSITGTYLTGVSSVTFDGVAATSVSVISALQVNCTTPAHVAGAVSVVMTNAGDSGTLASGFTFVDQPQSYPAPTFGKKILINGYDVSAWVQDWGEITEQKEIFTSERILTLSDFKFRLNNTNREFDRNHVTGFFYGRDYADMVLEVRISDVIRWKGLVKQVTSTQGYTEVSAEHILSDITNLTGKAVALTAVSPASAIESLLTSSSIGDIPEEYLDTASFAAADSAQSGLSIDVTVLAKDNVNIFSLIQDLCRLTACSLYARRDKIFLKQWQASDTNPVQMDLLASQFTFASEETDVPYESVKSAVSITYNGGTYAAGSGEVYAFNGGAGEQIEINDLTTATWMGTQVITNNQDQKRKLSIGVPEELEVLEIGDFLTLTDAVRGYSAAKFEVIRKVWNLGSRWITLELCR